MRTEHLNVLCITKETGTKAEISNEMFKRPGHSKTVVRLVSLFVFLFSVCIISF